MTLKVFMDQNLIPLIEELVESEANLLQKDVDNNNPSIKLSGDQIRFELFLLFHYLSGRGVSKIKGLDKFDSEINMKALEITNDIFSEKLANIKLSPRWIDDQQGVVAISNIHNYYLSKIRAYREAELSYLKNKISKQELRERISEIFLSVEAEKINDHLNTAIGEMHKGAFVILYKQLSSFSEKYQIVLDP